MSQPTSTPAQIVADTIVRTVELGVRITDAAVAGETTVLWCDLITTLTNGTSIKCLDQLRRPTP